MRILGLVIAFVVLLAAPARAHQSSVKYVDITIDGPRATLAVTIAPGDVTEPLGMPNDATPTVAQANVPIAAAYVQTWFVATACKPHPATSAPDPDGKFLIVRWEVVCNESIDELVLDTTKFFALDKRHEAIVTTHSPGAKGKPRIVRADDPAPLRVRADEAAPFAAWIGYGMDHIYEGVDHICFVLALLLVVVLIRGTHGWETREPKSALRSTAAIVTAFTLAHSASLIAASLGWIRLPSRFVESLIALSIVYTAVENVVRPDVRWRFGLTVAFGLVHGLGFASMLEELLPADDVIVPLVGFNLGVEIGQLTIVAVAFPVLYVLARVLGAERYRRYVLAVAAVPLVVVGMKWLIERAFGA